MDKIISNAGFNFTKQGNLYKLSIMINNNLHTMSIIDKKKDNIFVSTYSGYFFITLDKLSQVLEHLKKEWEIC